MEKTFGRRKGEKFDADGGGDACAAGAIGLSVAVSAGRAGTAIYRRKGNRHRACARCRLCADASCAGRYPERRAADADARTSRFCGAACVCVLLSRVLRKMVPCAARRSADCAATGKDRRTAYGVDRAAAVGVREQKRQVERPAFWFTAYLPRLWHRPLPLPSAHRCGNRAPPCRRG